MSKNTNNQRFGWLYDLRSIPIENKQYELIITKYLFYISRKSNGIMYLSFSQSFKYNNTSFLTTNPIILSKSNMEHEIKSLLNTPESKDTNLFDIFEKYDLFNPNCSDENKKPKIMHYLLRLIKLNNLELENELSDLTYFFKNKDITKENTKCIIGKSSTYLTSTFLIQSLYDNNDTDKLLRLLKYFNEDSSKLFYKSRSITKRRSIKAPSHNKQKDSFESLNKKDFTLILKSCLNNLYVCQDMFEEVCISIDPKTKNDNTTTKDNSVLSSLSQIQQPQVNNTINSYSKVRKRPSNLIIKEEWAPLSNKSFYSGDIKNNAPNGYGKEYRVDGLIYDGMFMNGKWHGVGTITNENLDTTVGEYINGRICGI